MLISILPVCEREVNLLRFMSCGFLDELARWRKGHRTQNCTPDATFSMAQEVRAARDWNVPTFTGPYTRISEASLMEEWHHLFELARNGVLHLPDTRGHIQAQMALCPVLPYLCMLVA